MKSWTSSTIPCQPGGKQDDWSRFQLCRLYYQRNEAWSLRKKKICNSCQEKLQKSQEVEKGRLRLQCRRVQRRIDWSSPSTQEILYLKCNNSTNNCKDLHAITIEEEKFQKLQKKQQRAKCSNWENFLKFVQNKKRRKTENSSTFKKCRFPTMKAKKVSPAWQKA